MRKVIIPENERGLLFRNGKLTKILGPGKYRIFGDTDIEEFFLSSAIESCLCEIETLLKNKDFAEHVSAIEVGDTEIALHYVNGQFYEALTSGKHAFWKDAGSHEFKIIDTTNPEVSDDVPKYIFEKIPAKLFKKVEVTSYQKARLYFDCKLVRVLDAGTYYFWRTGVSVHADYFDPRLVQMNITGQEIMTQDKVTLRINFVCKYKVTDYIKVITEIDNYEEQLHVAAQMALRDYVGRYKLDEILQNKEELTKYVFAYLKEREQNFFVEIAEAGVKDIILPGEIRDIMNTVLVAEKRAQANVITRREEVASTRSLLNTAKLMEENKTLYKLKELEYVEKICENVGSINLNGSGDVLTQLLTLMRNQTA